MMNFLKKDEPVKIRFCFTKEHREQNMTWDDEIVMYQLAKTEGEDAKDIDPLAIKIMAAHLMVDEKQNPIPEEKALKVLGKLNTPDRNAAFAKLKEAVQESIIPKEIGSDSTLPTQAGQATGTLPNG